MQLFIAHLGKMGVHHEDQADSYGNIGSAYLKDIDDITDARVQPATHNSCKHS